jgi:SWI/SNF-related matrix-associated actin-dependent regulator 1 of chromatin subfamily A
MQTKIPEIEARDILSTYSGFNNQLIDWKKKFEEVKNFQLTRPQAEYVLKYHEVTPRVAKKYISIVSNFGEKLMESKHLTKVPEKIWCEKLLCESDMAYHIWGRVTETEKNYPFWIPKSSIIQEEKKLKREVNYDPYSKRPPLEHQKVAIEKLLANDKFILADDMGLGKTTSAIIASLESGAKKILIICPATLKINWQREIENYSDRKTLIVEGRKWGSTFDFYIINYDIIKNYHTIDEPEIGEERNNQILNEKFDLAIVDEAHYISNTTAQRTRLINDILKNIPKVWLLTGTPMTSRPINFYNLLKIVNSNVSLNWQSYVKRYCGGYQFTVKKKKIWNTSGATNLDELRTRTKNIVLRRMKTDILDLPDKIITPIFLDLRSTFYDEELEEFIRITSENKNKESLSVTINRLMKVRQIIAQEKVEHTCEIIDRCLEQDKKIIVFTNFTSTLDMLHEKYKKNSVVLDGRMSKEKRQQSVDKFQNENKVKIFISNIVAGGVGITLTEAEVVIMNDLSFVPAHHSQAEDRAFRYGQKKNVLVYYPIFENTIEKIVYNMLQKKKNIIDQVMGDGEFSESFAESILKELV